MTKVTRSQTTLFRLMTFLSPAFPVGAFTYSHGLEQVVEQGAVSDDESLTSWLKNILIFGAGRNDAILLLATMRASEAGNALEVGDLRALGLALQPSRERHLETSAQGTAFVHTVVKSWLPLGDCEAASILTKLTHDEDAWPYPVAVGLICSAHDIEPEAALTAYLHAFVSNLVSAAIRTIPLGQNEGQSVISALEPLILKLSQDALSWDLEDLGGSSFLADIASMTHETQYSRLFRS